jgi:DNA-binding YbaB/EbfC family protein
MNVFNNFLKNAFSIKDKVEKVKNDLINIEIEGESGAGIVKVKTNARLEVLNINIEENAFKNYSKKELEELIKMATNDALRKAERRAVEEFKKVSEELSLPFDLSQFI